MMQQRLLQVSALGVFRYFTRHRTAANLLLLVMLAAGVYAAPRLHAQFFPDVVVENVNVSVSWPGAGAADVDAAIVQVVEPALMAVEGVSGSGATASEGRARISLEFEPGWDTERAVADIEDALSLLSTLPEEAEDPRISRASWGDRVANVVVSGPVGLEQLARFTDEYVARLYAEGITRTTIQGIASPEIAIEVPSLRLVQYDITLQSIARALAAAHQEEYGHEHDTEPRRNGEDPFDLGRPALIGQEIGQETCPSRLHRPTPPPHGRKHDG